MRTERRWWALVALGLGTFMTYLDNNIVNVALPTVQRELGLSMSGLEWIVSGYILVFAGLTLVGGRLADVYGRRRIFLAGIAVFTVASAAAGLAQNVQVLVGARAVQGVGAALLAPAALALLPATFTDKRERATAIGLWGAIGALAMALGPVTGGWITENTDWGWIYLINVPVGAVTMALALWALGTVPGSRRRLDLPGLAASAAALFPLTYALIEGEGRGWSSPLILGAFAVALAGAVAFVLVERAAAEPMVDLALLRGRVFGGGLLTMGIWAFAIFGIYFYTALWLQNVLGFGPLKSGLVFVPMALVLVVASATSPRLAARIGTHRLVAGGLALMGVAVLGLARIGADGTVADLMPWLLLYGVGGGALSPLTNAIVGTMPAGREGIASSVLNVSREVFGLLGVTVLGAIVSARTAAHAALGPTAAFLDGYRLALIIAGIVIALGVPLSLRALRPDRTPARPDLDLVA
ncbi:EmrB/QacA subfamily drug resistance transporter [Actinocorallia herbida]|uniref:EmrB/QacA subfamily drug resistance transporter n=1 Tax=Actinocorallia herbida TaxID=58109 RepID=A0A3N1D730_9ACTN|nr:MFS transporter [Actinocorallia herbida]ROO89343.1 EmrB/QacA subfamily drug resistance transporter [Actinocorallia herbida]